MPSEAIIDDYYAVLGVHTKANPATLKSAWRRLVKMKHPDKNPGNRNATTEFQLLESAYSTLSDPRRKKEYDNLRLTSFLKTNNHRATEHHGYRHPATSARPPPSPRHSQDPSSKGNTPRRHALIALLADKATQEANIARQRRQINALHRELGKLRDSMGNDESSQENPIRKGVWARIGATIWNMHKPNQERVRYLKYEELLLQFEVLCELESHLRQTEEEIRRLEEYLATK
ncbi:DnaJ-domain-containing protein [Hypoxylon sp. NC0597]|nr:DnaJ-domain-containing protein [Hypoxylon sp. NC0597]